MMLKELKLTLLLLGWKVHITFGKNITHFEKNGDTFVYNGYLTAAQRRSFTYDHPINQRERLVKNFKSNQEAADFLSEYS